MPAHSYSLVTAAAALVVLTFLVGLRMLSCRVREMRAKRIHPQAVSTSATASARYEDIRAADNFRNLFETPVLFYALVAVAVGLGSVPAWLSLGGWLYVLLRLVHTVIHCTYNNVLHRLAAFMFGFALLVGLWVALVVALWARSAG